MSRPLLFAPRHEHSGTYELTQSINPWGNGRRESVVVAYQKHRRRQLFIENHLVGRRTCKLIISDLLGPPYPIAFSARYYE
jgi:hypothetical protein